MCGIWTFINLLNKNIDVIKLYNNFMNLKNRGPDFSNFQIYNNIYVGFHRLSIMENNFKGNQPYVIEDNNKTIVFICNGEIYNFKELNLKYELNINSNLDCLVIPKLYNKFNNDYNKFLELFKYEIKGEFAFILLEFDNLFNLTNVISCRDQIGVRPLYYNNINYESSDILFSSELKGTLSYDKLITEYPPGILTKININTNSINSIDVHNFNYIYDINNYFDVPKNNTEEYYLEKIRYTVFNSIKRRLMTEKPIAFLLSGGVDSSLVAAISSRLLNETIYTYCCGLEEGTDFEYADMVAKHIKSNHTKVYFSQKEALDSIDNVIYTIESWDPTTIRASVGQYLVSKYISNNTNAKVVMVGDGSDEVCSSYLFNYYAPSDKELHNCSADYVKNIHMYDGRRADRCISGNGLETRIPFLDPEFIETYWSIPAKWRHPKYKNIEKWWLRKAFENTNLLPHDVLWRKKEAFSDGISGKEHSWFQIINNYINELECVKDYEYSNEYPTREVYYYKTIFIKHFSKKNINILPDYWQPKWTNNNNYIDPSARILDIYINV